MPQTTESISTFKLRLSSPITFLIAFLSPFLLYYTNLPRWFLLQLPLQLLFCLAGVCVGTWRFTALACLVLLIFHNGSWFAPKGRNFEECIANADLAVGTVRSNSLFQKSEWSLIRVTLSCKTDSVRIPLMRVAAGGKKLRNRYFREGDVVELSHFTLRKTGKWEIAMVSSDRTTLFNLTRQKRTLRRSALLLYVQSKARYYMARFPAAVFQALATADNSKMDGKRRRQIKELGIAHLFAISGMHIGILYVWIVSLFRIVLAFPLQAVKNGYLLLLCDLVALIAIYLFVDLIGLPISARRALAMLAWWVVLRHSVSWQPPWFILLGTASIILIEQPVAIAQLSFQLSFVAVAGILMLTPYLPKRKHLESGIKTVGRLALSCLSISGWLFLILFPLINRVFPYLFPLAIFGNVVHIFYMSCLYLPIALLTMGVTVVGFPFYGFPGERYLFSLVNVLGKLWENLVAVNAVWNRGLYWELKWNWNGVHLVAYWSLLFGGAWLLVRFQVIKKTQ